MSRVSPERQHQQQDETTADSDSDRDVPQIADIAQVFDEVIDIARDQLKHPISVKIQTWQDGEYQIRVRHSQGKPHRYRYELESAIQYHSDREDVEAFLVEKDQHGDDDEVLIEDVIGHIPDPLAKKGG